MDLSRYRDLFVSEARDHLRALGSLSMRGDRADLDTGTVNEMFRHAHSLKGMAATMQADPVRLLAHALEDLLARLRDNRSTGSPDLADLLLTAVDTLEQMVAALSRGQKPQPAPELIQRLHRFGSTAEAATAALPPLTVPNADGLRPEEEPTTRIKTALLDRLVNLSGELLTVRHSIEDWIRQHRADTLRQPLKELSVLLRQLQNEIVQARMVPFSSIVERFPRMVRDVARSCGKQVSLQTLGEDIELDRGILEQISEPLLHLLRNAVDHGIEPAAQRIAAGKAATGTIRLTVGRQADQITLEIADDGRGMDPVALRARAVDQGLLSREQAAALSAEESLLLACMPGFSTATTITEVSGRGVGMDVVQNAIQRLGGRLTIEAAPGRGTSITLHLPVSVAVMHALLVSCGGLQLAVPVNALNGTLEIRGDSLIQREQELCVMHNGIELPLRNLARFLCRREALPSSDLLPVLLTESNRQPVGLLVDRILGQQELFIRPLTQPLASLRGISGSCLLGNGDVIFVIDPAVCSGPLAGS